MHRIDVHFRGEVKEINVTRLVNCFFQIDQAVTVLVAPPSPVMIDMTITIEMEISGITDCVFPGAQAGVERGKSKQWLDRGAR